MVRFSDILRMDNGNRREMPSSEKDLRAGELPNEVQIKEKIDSQVPPFLFPVDSGSEAVRTCYKDLFLNAIGIRNQIKENQEIHPFPVISILRRIIDDNLIDDLHEYAISIPDDFGPPSRIVFVTIVHMKVGMKMGYDTNNLLKSGFATLLHSAGLVELPDHILQEHWVLTPDDIAAIRKNQNPALEMLAYFITKSQDTFPEGTEDLEIPGPQILGVIPHADEKGIRKSMEDEGRKVAHDADLLKNLHLVCHFAHKSAPAGSFRALRTNLLLLGVGEKIKTLAITSGSQGEGKTTVSANLAITMAQAGMKTLLAGAEMKKSSLPRSFGKGIIPGLADVLLDNYSWRDVIITLSDMIIEDADMVMPELDCLHIITSGTTNQNSAEFIDARGLDVFIEETKKEYDIVIFDTSSILSTTGPLILGTKVDAVLVVSRAAGATESLQKEGPAQLPQGNGNIMGIVVNDVKEKGGKGLRPHITNRGFEQAPLYNREPPDFAYKELAETATEKKTGSGKFFLWVVVLALIVVGSLWLVGIVPFEKSQEKEPALLREKIIQPMKIPSSISRLEKEGSSQRDGQAPIEEDKHPLGNLKPVISIEEPKPVPASVKPVPVPIVRYPYSLHMGSLKGLRSTGKFMASLKEKRLSPYWTRVDLVKKGIWYRVFVGQFSTSDKADEFQKKHGITADRILKTAYAAQIGDYTSKEELDQRISTLKESGFSPYFVEQPQGRYLLLIGAYQTKRAAEAFAAKLKGSGLDCRMVLR